MKFEDEGLFVGPSDGKDLKNHPVGGGMVLKVRDKDTADAYSIYDNTIPPALGDLGPTFTATTRRLFTSWKDN